MDIKNELIDRNKMILLDAINNVDVNALSEKYNLSKQSIRLILRKNKVEFNRTKYLSDIDKEYIKSNYDKMSSTKIAKEIGCSRSSVLKVWMDNGLKGKDASRQYYCNFNYFNIIDKPEKAYWLGVLASDGCVFKRNGHQAEIKLSINKDDIEMLANLNEALEGNYPYNYINNVVTMSVISDKIVKCLENHNITTNKTWTFYPTNIPNEYYIDFIIGFFDGDGSITKKKTDRIKAYQSDFVISIVSNMKCLEVINGMLNECGITSILKENKTGKYTNKFGEIRISNCYYKYVFAKLLLSREYKTLIRKRTRLTELVYSVENNISNKSNNIKAVEKYNHLKHSWNL